MKASLKNYQTECSILLSKNVNIETKNENWGKIGSFRNTIPIQWGRAKLYGVMMKKILRKTTHVSQSRKRGGCQASVRRGAVFLQASRAHVPAGLSCQVHRMV